MLGESRCLAVLFILGFAWSLSSGFLAKPNHHLLIPHGLSPLPSRGGGPFRHGSRPREAVAESGSEPEGSSSSGPVSQRQTTDPCAGAPHPVLIRCHFDPMRTSRLFQAFLRPEQASLDC